MAFKILSLDGGGIRGVLSARLLQEVESQIQAQHGQKLHEYFDLIAGTSTGSLIAAGICLEKSATELLDIYRNRGQEIFPERIRRRRNWPLQIGTLWGFLYPHGDPETGKPGLSTVLSEEFGETTIADVGNLRTTASGATIEQPILLIMAYDTLSRNTTFFASNNLASEQRWYDKFPLWKICTASASAPTYFPPYDLPYHQDQFAGQVLPHIDGGVSANNPSLAAVTHAMLTAEASFDDITVLSIGTGQATEPYTYKQISSWKPLNWIQNLPNIFLDPGTKITNTVCNQLLNARLSSPGNYRHLRLDFELNHHFNAREAPRKLRTIADDPVNQYVRPKQSIPEAIDDPNAFYDLKTAAEAYLERGNVLFTVPQWSRVSVKEAIATFIQNNPPTPS